MEETTMSEAKIFLGKVKKDFNKDSRLGNIGGEMVWLTKHSWDCGWYWGFGYIGNRNMHTHFDSCFLECQANTASEIFEDAKFTNNEWWVIRDLMVQAYALKSAAEIYKHGGHQTTKKEVTDIILDDAMCTRLNKDLKTVLDKVWEYMEDCIANQTMLKDEISQLEKEVEKIKEKKEATDKDFSGKMAALKELKTHLNK